MRRKLQVLNEAGLAGEDFTSSENAIHVQKVKTAIKNF